MLGEDDSHCALVSVDFEATPKFELLEDFMHEELTVYSKEANYGRYLKKHKWGHVDMIKFLFLILFVCR